MTEITPNQFGTGFIHPCYRSCETAENRAKGCGEELSRAVSPDQFLEEFE